MVCCVSLHQFLWLLLPSFTSRPMLFFFFAFFFLSTSILYYALDRQIGFSFSSPWCRSTPVKCAWQSSGIGRSPHWLVWQRECCCSNSTNSSKVYHMVLRSNCHFEGQGLKACPLPQWSLPQASYTEAKGMKMDPWLVSTHSGFWDRYYI